MFAKNTYTIGDKYKKIENIEKNIYYLYTDIAYILM